MTRKLQFLLTALLLMVGVTSAWAQSTYSWSASNWENDSRGSVTEENGTLKVTQVKNHLVGIKTKSSVSFKLPLRQTYLIVTGTGFASATNDPNATIGGKKTTAKVKETTRFVVDVTEGLKTLEMDFFGNVTVPQVSIIVMTNKGNDKNGNTDSVDDISEDNPTITDISFYQPDFLDAQTAISATQGGNSISTTTTTSSNKTSLKFTPTATSEIFLQITAPQYINPSNAFLVVESSTNFSDNTTKFAGVNDSGLYGYTGGNGAKTALTVDGHLVRIFSPAANNNAFLEKLVANEGSSAAKARFYLTNSTASEEVVFYRIGFYNLREIFDLYPSMKSMKWQHVSNSTLRMEKAADTGGLVIKDANNKVPSVAHGIAMFRILGDIQGKNELDYRNMVFADAVNPEAFTEDVISNFSNGSLKVLFSNSNTSYKYFPTMAKKVQIAHSSYYQYKDEEALTGGKVNHGTPAKSVYSYTRKLNAGYSSMILPFAVEKATLTSLGITPYQFSNATEGGEVTFAKVSTDDIAANTPLVVNTETAGYYLIPAKSEVNTANTDISPNNYYATTASNGIKFVGSFVNEVPSGDYAAGTNCVNYGITTDGTKFAKMADTTKTNYYRAFISDQRSGSGVGYAPAYLNVNFGGITGISDIEIKQNVMENDNAPIYNLNGVRMNADNLPKGIYIKNGKKFVIK